MKRWNMAALAVVLASAPLAAQVANEAAPPPAPTPTPTPSPAPAGNSVGPPQLRDFNLNGTVTQPAQPATPTPTPTPTPAPAPRAPTTRPSPPRTAPAPSAVTQAPAPSGETSVPAPSATLSQPLPGEAVVESGPVVVPAAPAPPPVAEESAVALWPWLAAVLAIALGAGFLWWRRRQGSGERYAADHGDAVAFVAPPVAAPAPLPRATPTPPPVPPVSPPAPAPAPAPIPEGIVSSRLTPSPISDGIVSSRLKPALAFELLPLRVDTDAVEGAALTFDLIIVNQGSAPARDVLVEAKLINAGPQVDAEVGQFFMQPAGTGDRLPLIAPMGRASLRMRVGASGPNLAPLTVDGRKLLVPMVAINAAYRWSGGELTDSSSFLVGRGGAEGGKMAPIRLDLGARSWSQLGARLHSSGLQR